MSNFTDFINTVIIKGDTGEARRRWRPQYKDQRLYDGRTALHYACMPSGGNQGSLVRLLVSLGCDTEAKTDTNGWRPLHYCVINGKLEAMRALLDAGCSISPLDNNGESPLMMAYKRKRPESIALLRSAIEVERINARAASKDDCEDDTKYVKLREVYCSKFIIPHNWTHHVVPKPLVVKTEIDYLQLLKTNSLSKIMEPETGNTVLDQMLSSKDQNLIDAIKAKQVDVQEINDWKDLLKNASQVDPQSLQLLQECLLYRCMDQKYPNGAYILCTANIVNRDSLFMGPTALETAVRSGLEVWVHEVLYKLVEVNQICPICEDEPLNCGLNCGHVFCKTCVQKTVDCYACRARITNTFKLFL